MKRITLIYGKTGTGKTTLSKSIIKNLDRVVIIDALEDYDNSPFVIVNDFDSMYDYLDTHDKYKLSCRFSTQEEIDYTFKLIKTMQDVCLVVEEASIYISPQQQSNDFIDLAKFGRHNNIQLIGISRRSAELTSNFRALTECIISFKQTEPMDLINMQKLGFTDLDKLDQFQYTSKNPIPTENKHYIVKYL